jgi:hypothetical protein
MTNEWLAVLTFAGAGVCWHGRELYKKFVLDPLAQKITVYVHQKLLPEGTTAPQQLHDRTNLVFELFLSSVAPRTDCIPPTAWSQNLPDVEVSPGKKTYGHEAAVIHSILRFVGQSGFELDIKDDSWLANTGSSRVMLASGSSNLASQEVIGTPINPTFCPKLGAPPVNLAYAIGIGEGRVKRLQYGGLIERQALCVRKKTGKRKLQAEMDSGRQTADYLLVTRVPGFTQGSVYTVLSGLHGPGTRSAELLFNSLSLKDLEELASRIDHKSGKVPFFQAIFRASKFDPASGSDVPSHLELVTEGFPPARLTG